jgi:pimeloyl-ACP methyl ester carboxylesterase
MDRKGRVQPPCWLLSATDVPRATYEAFSLLSTPAWFAALPRGDGHPVMVLPGFAGSDDYNRPLIQFLKQLGYHAVGWKQGRNLGHSILDPHRLGMRVAKLHEHEGRRISLVGHSLGGVFAREAARRHPERVRQVISLGSPIGRNRGGASRLDAVYFSLNRVPGQTDEAQWHIAPPVPTTAVYSRGDGILDWRVALQCDGHPQTENIEVWGSHNGMTLNPMVWMLLANRLAQTPDSWQPFRTRGLLRLLYPKPAWRATQRPSRF